MPIGPTLEVQEDLQIIMSSVEDGGTATGTNTGDQNTFSTIAVAGQSNVVADSTSDTLTLVAGSNITLTTNATNDEITIASTGGGGGSVAWGGITGTLSDQTDLQTALNAKVNKSGDTMTGALVNSTNGAVSTPPMSLTGSWYSGGTATTTKPQVLIEPTGTTSNTWSTSGTGLGVNAASGFAGNLLDLQVNGTSRVRVTSAGNVGIGTSNPERLFHINATAVPSVREALFKGSVSDAGNDAFFIGNGTSVDGRFVASFQGYVDSTNSAYSQGFWGLTNAANDTSDSSTFGLLHFAGMRTDSQTNPTNGNLSNIVNRKILTIGGAGTNVYFTVAAGGNIGIGTLTPTAKLHVVGTTIFNGTFTIENANNIVLGTTTGTKIGTATTQKLGFYNATPVVQPAAIADATDAASAITQLNLLLARMRTLGLIAT